MIPVRLDQDQVSELEDLFHKTTDRRLRDRLQIVRMAHARRPRGQIAQDLGLCRRSVQRWLNAYNRGGLSALQPRQAPGARRRIPEELAEPIRQWVIQGPQKACGLDLANWTYESLAAQIRRHFHIRIRHSAMHEFCRRHDIRPYRPNYRFLRGDPAKQAAARRDLAALKKGRSRETASS